MHVAYLPSLSDSFQDLVSNFHHKWSTQRDDILAHCKRELMHSAWRFLLDDEFIHAYRYGIIIRCYDGVERRVYPRILTYSADYPEKIILSTIRGGKSLCPCPRCMVPLKKFDLMGQVSDRLFRQYHVRKYFQDLVTKARKFVYQNGIGVRGKAVEDLLKSSSSNPTFNAFIERLGPGFDISRLLVVDFLHEFELGVWKALFTHLIRILHAAASNGRLVTELDGRFRQIPTFGSSGTIRNFATNASEMKKLAGRDFEDLLQCAIPAFEGLLEEPHNSRLMTLLFRTAEWHAFAKLRIQSELTLVHLENLTTEFGDLTREFRDLTCTCFDTVDLPREIANQQRSKQHKKATKQPPNADQGQQPHSRPKPTPAAKARNLNLGTYKFHALGDYVAHRTVKRLYGMTNKRDVESQIAQGYTQLEISRHSRAITLSQQGAVEQNMDLPVADTSLSYQMSSKRDRPVYLWDFMRQNRHDPACQGFIPKLRDHLLGRILQSEDVQGDGNYGFGNEERNCIHIVDDCIYAVNSLRINYTTYDIHRDHDHITPKSHPDILVVSADDEPFWYARVIGIYHANIWTSHPDVAYQTVRKMEFLWVRWFGTEPDYVGGFKPARLPKLGFVESSKEDAFTFIDPNQVLRGCHLIPAFNEGRTQELLPFEQSIARVPRKGEFEGEDWLNYYVNIFVDRDMVMKFFGSRIGHSDERHLDREDIMDVDPDAREYSDSNLPSHHPLPDAPPTSTPALASVSSLDDGDHNNGVEDDDAEDLAILGDGEADVEGRVASDHNSDSEMDAESELEYATD
ncbi:hypothetical protein M378DRAFT_131528 [Amanita muscaria Koide BX008]|uniref:Uncharacterized protein n=1 Tax=Amanita muscaria (strain Koide BX008) TaxID=946122 RepID=A0A0C2WT14_AMAMK|nr:hypothetical protein M378DRAFT_131528 [Amanita muscaria Koide BX008]